MRRFAKASEDSLFAAIRNDYAICVGDASRLSRDQLTRWKAGIDSVVMAGRYPEMFHAYVAATGIKAHDVRPCEPIIYAERREREKRETDSTLAARKAAREKVIKDSVDLFRELASLTSSPADLMNIPAGLSKSSLQTLLARHKIAARPVQRHLQADRVRFRDITVSIAFYFDDADKFNGYEIETEAVRAERIDNTVRDWAAKLTRAYEEMLGPPTIVNRVGFRDIKQGKLSITANWERGPARPRVLVGLATHDHQYYAKVMVNY
ncbi:MAG: hypothetical protein FWC23_07450 [Chitinispirillia bacterium]|nr:hypothetical protein [Chitinispirillia bacterium]MCL2269004.1 hypothetical protein [Chitinispirillia bacterium]